MPGGGNAPNLGRNRPCWYGSGKKVKFCHGNPAKIRPKEENSDGFAELLSRATAYEKQRENQQGLGKPITSVSVGVPLGAYDLSDRLLIPEKLYGRDREIDPLFAAFDRVVASGAPELALVSGYSGIGKSSLVFGN